MTTVLFYRDNRKRILNNLRWICTHTSWVRSITVFKHSDGGGTLRCDLQPPMLERCKYSSWCREPIVFVSTFEDYTILQRFIRRPSWKGVPVDEQTGT